MTQIACGQEAGSIINMSEETITISIYEYEDLLEDSRWLNALENAGVDNWIGIDQAKDAYNEENENDL